MTEQIIKTLDQDSLEFGSPTKGGKIKVYGDFNNKEDFQKKLDVAIELSTYAVEKIGNK